MTRDAKQPTKPKPAEYLCEKLGKDLTTGDEVRSPRITPERLQAVLGLGDQPRVTLALYAKLARGCFEHGYEFEKIVRTCLKACRSADKPERYFSCSVTRRLRESGF